MTETGNSRLARWLRSPWQRGAFVLWAASTLMLLAFAVFPIPFSFEDEVQLEERPGVNARNLDQIAVSRSCLRAIGGEKADELERDFILVDYITNEYAWIIDEGAAKLFVPPESEYRILRADLVRMSSRLERGIVCDTFGAERARHCTTMLSETLFRRVVSECGKDAPLYWNKVGTRIEWKLWDNISNVDNDWSESAGWVWLLSSVVLLFGGLVTRLWRWVRFG